MLILKRAIDTVWNQTYSDVELIIVNDYPPYIEKINQLIEKNYMGKRLFIIHNEANMGACYSRNEGIKNANGEYIAFLDDDDEWFPEKLSKQYAAISKNSNIAMVYCSGINVYSNGNKNEMSFIKDTCDTPLKNLLATNYIGGSSFPLIRKEVLCELNGFDTVLLSSQDYDLWIRIVSEYNIVFISEPLVLYYIMEDSITSNPSKRIQGYNTLLRKHKVLYQRFPQSAIGIFKSIISVYVEHRYYNKVAYYLLKSFQYFPYNLSLLRFWSICLLKKLLL
ncbi:glycosyltransferase [Prevotella sp. PMUR]|uniref:Glycosyltransferase n=2 Tax=Xylanibacter muris TaxID=2736290 RepID=A0ABX2AS69_9BACT|nr:glycosyltransferase [Xylanibacter muris]